MDLIQIVPALPPTLSGVGDYAILLAREILARHGTGTRFIVGEPGWDSPAAVAPFPTVAVAGRSAQDLCSLLDGPGTVLLHYVPYGYAHRGCPFWLVDAVERWKRAAGPASRLMLLFHEVAASGPPWSSAFWLGPFQQRLAARLARVADARRITTSISLRELRLYVGRTGNNLPTTVAPVFSTLGEQATPLPLSARERQAVVFGSRPWREAVYAQATGLEVFCRRHGITRVIDVGAPLAGGARCGGIEIREAGALPAAEASELFARSLAGCFTYPAPHLGKSTIFAAYCAHGMVPVTFPGNDGAEEGLRRAEHYLEWNDAEADFEAVARAAHAWYGAHRLCTHADEIHRLMSA